MNRLIDANPVEVEINGRMVPINTDYKDALLANRELGRRGIDQAESRKLLLFYMYESYGIREQEQDMTLDDQVDLFLELFLDEIGADPNAIREAVDKALWFLRCGEEVNTSRSHEAPLVDFEIDNRRIYDAFLKLGIVLSPSTKMHWWDFCSRFSELPECRVTRLAYLRHMRQKGKKMSKEELEECARIGWDAINMVSAEDIESARAERMANEQVLNGAR